MASARSLSQFQKAFSDEASCAAFMFKRRWPDGFVCPACGKRRVAAQKIRPRLHECLDCGRQTSVTAGTVMHRSRLPLTTWFWAAHLMTTHSNGMSALQLQDQLGVTYKTVWLLTQKLRRSMVDPDREPLEGVVEVDQAEIAFREGDTFFEPGNAGKILVIGAVEIIERDTNQAKPRRKHAKYLDTRSGRIRLAMISDNSSASIEAFVNANVKRGATLLTDGHKSYPGLTGYRHDPRVVGKMAAHIVLPWIHRAFSLMRRWSLGTYHGSPQARRYLSQRIRISLQSPILPTCFIRNAAGARRRQRARELLGHHQARQSTQKREPGGIGAPPTYRRA
jgi:transposase-like protein